MTRERWEVRAPSGFCERRFTSRPEAVKWLQVRALAGETVVHVRVHRVEVVYAWRMTPSRTSSEWWSDGSSCVPAGWNRYMYRRIFTDPLGKHSRRRAKAAALAAKPAGPCVLVAVRRRVKE